MLFRFSFKTIKNGKTSFSEADRKYDIVMCSSKYKLYYNTFAIKTIPCVIKEWLECNSRLILSSALNVFFVLIFLI